MIIRVLAPLAVAALCGGALWQIVRPSVPKLLYNPSPSAPIGWYRLRADQDFVRGDLVAAFAPDDAQKLVIERHYLPPNIPLIKTVWATAGEEICHSKSVVQVDNRPPLVMLSHDSRGLSLPSRDGCYTLAKDEVFLVSTDVQTSFDSRYFGPVPVSDILGPVQYLGRFQRGSERRKAGRG
jgi:conjugative transfer signal peptidase TraF